MKGRAVLAWFQTRQTCNILCLQKVMLLFYFKSDIFEIVDWIRLQTFCVESASPPFPGYL